VGKLLNGSATIRFVRS